LLGVYSEPSRDPRGHTVSLVYVAKGEGEVKALDDAKNILLWKVDEPIPTMAFDHKIILEDYLEYRAARD